MSRARATRGAGEATLLLLLAIASTAHANPADVVGMGARGAAMAGAQVAAVDDSTANYYNPAQLAADDAAIEALTADWAARLSAATRQAEARVSAD